MKNIKGKTRSCICVLLTRKRLFRAIRKIIECTMRNKGLSEVMVRAVMSSYDGTIIRMRVGSAYSEKF